jgi:bifunctional non-homologous end joining protein LigD
VSALRFGSRRVDLTHPDRVLFPDDGLTKRDVLDHYLAVADPLLATLRDRPVTLHCFPGGIDADGYFRQAVEDHFPDWMAGASRRRAEGEGRIERILVGSRAALAVCAKYDAITLHAGLARAPRLDRCDRMIFDLDPPGDDFEAVRHGARRLCERLRALGATPALTTTGSRGVHVVVPVRPEADHDRVRRIAVAVGERLVDDEPDAFTLAQRRRDRGDRLYLDVLRIALGQTAVAPWALRARPGAPVAMPITEKELADRRTHARRWRVGDVAARLRRTGDPWRGLGRHAVRPARLERALGLDGRGG